MFLGICGKAPWIFTQDKDSHHIGRILLQWINKWAASSSMLLQNGQHISLISTCRLCKFVFVGNLSLSNLHAKTKILLGIFIFHNSSKHPSWFPSNVFPLTYYKHFVPSIAHLDLPSTPNHLFYVATLSCFQHLLGSYQPWQSNCRKVTSSIWNPTPTLCSCELSSAGWPDFADRKWDII